MIYFLIILFLIILCITYMFFQAHHDTIDYRLIKDERLPDNFNNFRMFFISDIHRRMIKETTLQSINEKIDTVVIGGDLTEKGVPLERTLHNIKKLKKWNAPIYFVWGNNDYEALSEQIYAMLIEENVTILTNSNTDIERNGQIISLIGVDCCKYREARIDLAWKAAKGEYFILITHDPSSFNELNVEDQNNIHTVLAGHTHGGQIRIFGFGPFERGSFKKERNTYKLISEGYGFTTLPFRLGTKAECHVLTFKN